MPPAFAHVSMPEGFARDIQIVEGLETESVTLEESVGLRLHNRSTAVVGWCQAPTGRDNVAAGGVRYERNPGDCMKLTEAPPKGCDNSAGRKPILLSSPGWGTSSTPPQPGAALIPPRRDSLAPGYPALRDLARFGAFLLSPLGHLPQADLRVWRANPESFQSHFPSAFSIVSCWL